MKKILIIGAASAIAHETAKKLIVNDAELFLADLRPNRLESIKLDLEARYRAKIHIAEFDATDFAAHARLIQMADEALGGIDAALIAYGTLPNQEEAQHNPEITLREFNLNGTSVIMLSTALSNYFEQKGKGTLAVISSVAGDRGRQSNYIYGAAKGAVSLFLQGLRNRLSGTNIKIITIKPGMVDTPMTAHMPKSPLFSKPETIAAGIVNAMTTGKDVAYLPGFWRLVMFVIKHIPEPIFKKMKL